MFSDPQFACCGACAIAPTAVSTWSRWTARARLRVPPRRGRRHLPTKAIEVSPTAARLLARSAGRDRAAVMAQDLASAPSASSPRTPRLISRALLDPVSCVPIAAPSCTPSGAGRCSIGRRRRLRAGRRVGRRRAWRVRRCRRPLELGRLREPAGRPGRFFHYDLPPGASHGYSRAGRARDGALVPLEPVVVTARDGLKLVCTCHGRATRRPPDSRADGAAGSWRRGAATSPTSTALISARQPRLQRAQRQFPRLDRFGKAFVNAADGEWRPRCTTTL